MKEEWKNIKGFEGYYQVSNMGRIRSLSHYASNGRCQVLYKGRIIKLSKRNGYLVSRLCKNNKVSTISVHRIVAETFMPHDSEHNVVNHKDGNKANNIVSNLEWTTQKENLMHALDTGLRKLKVPYKHQIQLYNDYIGGMRCKQLMDKYGIKKTRLYTIIKGVKNGSLDNQRT